MPGEDDEEGYKKEEYEEDDEEEERPKRKKGRRKGRGRKIILAIVILVIILAPLAATVQEPDVNVTALTLEATGTDTNPQIKTLFTVDVYNPNIVGATVLRIEGQAFVDDDYAGDFLRTESVVIPAMGSTSFDIEFFLKNVFLVWRNHHNEIRVVGTVTLDGAVTDWEVDFDETENVYIP